MSAYREDRPRFIFFDLGGTLLARTSWDPIKGARSLLELATHPRGLGPEEVHALAASMDAGMESLRDESCIELSSMCFQRTLFDILGARPRGTPLELERAFWNAAVTYQLTPGVAEALDRIGRLGIGMAVISNSNNSGAFLEEELERQGIRRHFRFLLSSTDYGFRKPSRWLFEAALAKAGVEADTAWHVGDSFRHDVAGALGAGIGPVWYRPHSPPDPQAAYPEIREWKELVQRLSEPYIV